MVILYRLTEPSISFSTAELPYLSTSNMFFGERVMLRGPPTQPPSQAIPSKKLAVSFLARNRAKC